MATNWIHTIHYKKGFNLTQCLFGEHLLAEDLTSPVAIVESEKTAVSLPFPTPALTTSGNKKPLKLIFQSGFLTTWKKTLLKNKENKDLILQIFCNPFG